MSRTRNSSARRVASAAALFSLAAPALSGAQTLGPATRRGEPRFMGGGDVTVAQPVGEFGDYVRNGVGVGLHGLARLGGAGAFAVRLDGNFVQYGRERTSVRLSPTVGGRISADLTTSNNIYWIGVGPQLMAPRGTVRPYVNGSVGYTFFETESSLQSPRSADNEPLFRTTNLRDNTVSYGGGLGTLVRVAGSARSIVFLDLGARYNSNGRVQYLREGDIQDLPNGDVILNPVRSRADLWTYHVGVSIGGR